MSKKRVMILGAGPFQVPAIRKAVSLGLHVITVDYLPDNIGHRYSHQYVNCSTTDREGVLRAARQLGIDGICTFSSDVAIPTVAYVSRCLGLPGTASDVAETMAYKQLFRSFLREKGLPCPAFITAPSSRSAREEMKRLRFPIVVKPVDTSGSRGISKVPHYDPSAIDNALNHAMNFSHSGKACIEEYIHGTEVGGDGFLHEGRFSFIAVTHKHMNGFIVTGHSMPASISGSDQERVRNILEACCNALGYCDGPLNFDVMITPDQVFILEMSARNGGNGIPAVIFRAVGVDVEVMTIRYALGDHSRPFSPGRDDKGAGSYIFGSAMGGMLKHISGLDDLQAEIPEVFDLFLATPIGDEVKPFTHNGNLIGYALFDCSSSGAYESIAERIEKAIRLEVSAVRTQ